MNVNWIIEDNVVTLYLAMYGAEGLDYSLNETEEIIANTLYKKEGFKMRVRNYKYIITEGKEGLDAGYPEGFPLYKELHDVFREIPKDKFIKYINIILKKRNRFPRVEKQVLQI